MYCLKTFNTNLLDSFLNFPDYSSSNSYIKEEEEHYLLEVEIPGVERDEITLETKDTQLTIKAERKRGKETIKYNEQLSLEKIDSENITATLENGILTVKLPKKVSAKAMKIPIA